MCVINYITINATTHTYNIYKPRDHLDRTIVSPALGPYDHLSCLCLPFALDCTRAPHPMTTTSVSSFPLPLPEPRDLCLRVVSPQPHPREPRSAPPSLATSLPRHRCRLGQVGSTLGGMLSRCMAREDVPDD